jgi:hypothetical protein
LRVPTVYQANVFVGSLASGLCIAYALDSGAYLATVTFLLTFLIAAFVTTTVVPLVPPSLERR